MRLGTPHIAEALDKTSLGLDGLRNEEVDAFYREILMPQLFYPACTSLLGVIPPLQPDL